MQSIRHENLKGFLQTSDRKPGGLSFRQKNSEHLYEKTGYREDEDAENFFKRGFVTIRMFSFVLTKWYQLSPICAADGPPFLSRKELRFSNLPLSYLLHSYLYRREYSASPL